MLKFLRGDEVLLISVIAKGRHADFFRDYKVSSGDVEKQW
jgi:hypothetical protein